MEYIIKALIVYLVLIGATNMEPIVVAFMLTLYVAPVLLVFAALAALADFIEKRF